MIKTVITPMNFTLVRDSIVQHLVNVRESQKQLAKESGATDLWINQIINFTVFPKSCVSFVFTLSLYM